MAEVLQYLIRVRGGRQGKREADQTAEGFDNIAAAANRAQVAVGAQGLTSTLNNVSGRLKLAVGAAALFGPALISVGASASAAAAGGAAVAGGGIGALSTGLLGFGLIAKGATDDIKKVRTALDQYHMVVAQHGRYSLEAYRAERTLFAAVKENGGRQVLQAARNIDALGKSWRRATVGARASVFGTLNDAIGAARRLIPTFARETTRNAFVIRQVLRTAFTALSGREMQGNIEAFSAAFRRMAGPIGRGITNLFLVLGRIMRAALPYAISTARWFERLTMSWRRGTRDGGRVSDTIRMLVGHFKAWWGLIKAVGYVLGGLFTTSQAQGKGLVESLTGVLTKFGDWMRTAEGQKRMRQWFTDSARAVRDVATALAQLAVAAYPIIMFISRHLKTIVTLWLGWKAAMFGTRAALGTIRLVEWFTSAEGGFARLRTTMRTMPWGSMGSIAGRAFGAAMVTMAVKQLTGWNWRRTVQNLAGGLFGAGGQPDLKSYKPPPGAPPFKPDSGPLRLQPGVLPTDTGKRSAVKPLSRKGGAPDINVKIGNDQLAKILGSTIDEAMARNG